MATVDQYQQLSRLDPDDVRKRLRDIAPGYANLFPQTPTDTPPGVGLPAGTGSDGGISQVSPEEALRLLDAGSVQTSEDAIPDPALGRTIEELTADRKFNPVLYAKQFPTKTRKIVEVIHKTGGPSRKSASIHLTTEQRRKFVSVVETTGSTRGSLERIELREGMTLPDEIELLEVPDTVVSEVPEIREYRYVVVNHEIGLVEPDTRRVVEVFEE